MFVMGILVPRWTSINFAPVVSDVPLAEMHSLPLKGQWIVLPAATNFW